jgi:hypothetical protein
VISRIQASVLWIYDFLAEDPILLIGVVVAIIATLLLVQVTASAVTGFVLWGIILIGLAASVARTAVER